MPQESVMTNQKVFFQLKTGVFIYIFLQLSFVFMGMKSICIGSILGKDSDY